MDSEQRAGEPTVLTAKPDPFWPRFVFVFQYWFTVALAVVVCGGLIPPKLLTIVLFLAGTALCFLFPVLERLSVLDVLSYDEEGVVLRPSRRGFFAPKAISFRWDELAAVRRDSIPSGHALRVSLVRVHRFWTLHPRGLTMGPYFWRDEGFRQALRRHVPADKIATGVLDEAGATRRKALLAGGALLACAGGVALAAMLFLFGPGASFLLLAVPLPVSCLLGYRVWRLGFDGLSGAAEVVGGALLGAPSLFLSLDLLALLNERWWSTHPAGAFATSGLLLGAALMVFLGPRTRWSHVGLLYLFGLAGWGVGLIASDGVPSVLLGEVTTSEPEARWTVTGDGFVLEQRAGERVLLQWYSADGKPGRSVAIPGGGNTSSSHDETDSSLLMAGPEAAIFEVASEGRHEGFVVPRYGGGARLIVTKGGWLDVGLSPDGRRCVFLTLGEGGATWAVSYLELPDGELQDASLPPGQEKVERIGILNDGRLVLVTGERPKDLEGRRMWYSSELPQGDSWKPTYEPVKVWLWDPHGDEAPRLLHAEEGMSLDWALSTTSSPLYLCRVVGDGPRRKEFVEVGLDSDPPEVRPSSPSRFELWWWAYQASADGRFLVKTYGENPLSKMYVRDTLTGRRRRLRDQPGWSEPWVLWSPQGHKFLYTTEQVPFTFAADFGLSVENIQWVARFVDLDR